MWKLKEGKGSTGIMNRWCRLYQHLPHRHLCLVNPAASVPLNNSVLTHWGLGTARAARQADASCKCKRPARYGVWTLLCKHMGLALQLCLCTLLIWCLSPASNSTLFWGTLCSHKEHANHQGPYSCLWAGISPVLCMGPTPPCSPEAGSSKGVSTSPAAWPLPPAAWLSARRVSLSSQRRAQQQPGSVQQPGARSRPPPWPNHHVCVWNQPFSLPSHLQLTPSWVCSHDQLQPPQLPALVPRH